MILHDVSNGIIQWNVLNLMKTQFFIQIANTVGRADPIQIILLHQCIDVFQRRNCFFLNDFCPLHHVNLHDLRVGCSKIYNPFPVGIRIDTIDKLLPKFLCKIKCADPKILHFKNISVLR